MTWLLQRTIGYFIVCLLQVSILQTETSLSTSYKKITTHISYSYLSKEKVVLLAPLWYLFIWQFFLASAGSSLLCLPVCDKGNAPLHWSHRIFQFSSVQSLSHVWVFWPHGLQHARPPCPSPTPGVYSNSCPLTWWCHSTISSSVIPFSHCTQLPESSSSSQGFNLKRWTMSVMMI